MTGSIAGPPNGHEDEATRLRWQRERAFLEQEQRDQRILLRRRIIFWLVVSFLVSDLIVSVTVILAATSR
jgi:hypothetical protein